MMALTTGVLLLALAAAFTPAAAQDANAVLDTPVAAQEAGAGVPPSSSVQQADARLADVARQRGVVEAAFADSERACYTKFFVNNCIDKARETRRAALAPLRAIEVEASHFKRAHAVEQRDRALAEQAAKDAADAAQRAALPARPAAPAIRPAAGVTPATRQAEHAAKVERQRVQDAADAGKRAANVAAFEKKQRDSAERQRKVAANRAAKEEQARKDAAAKK